MKLLSQDKREHQEILVVSEVLVQAIEKEHQLLYIGPENETDTKNHEEFLKIQGTSNLVDPLPLIETIIYIIPSINVFSFLITFLINFNITRFMIRKFKFSNIYNFDIRTLKLIKKINKLL